MGLNSGEVVVGKIGDDLCRDYTALGHTASLGARMEQIAAPDRAYLTEHTAKLVEGLVQLEDLGRSPSKEPRNPSKCTPVSRGWSRPVPHLFARA
jgi:class 3 adenylate cyclase